ncbi:hypothetical protein STEG23_000043, partial [Scotinomys teguina]
MKETSVKLKLKKRKSYEELEVGGRNRVYKDYKYQLLERFGRYINGESLPTVVNLYSDTILDCSDMVMEVLSQRRMFVPAVCPLFTHRSSQPE